MKANRPYEDKLRAGNAPERVMLALLCDIDTLKKLNEQARTLVMDISGAQDLLEQPECQRTQANLSRKLTNIRKSLQDVVKGVYQFKRRPATHIFLLMVSSELRNHKPYAVPIQYLPYAGLKESDLRRFVTRLVQEMDRLKMKVAGKNLLVIIPICFSGLFLTKGFVSNGEFNYLRSKGCTRPLSVLQICADVRNKYSRLKQETLLDMLTPKGIMKFINQKPLSSLIFLLVVKRTLMKLL